MQIAAPLGDFWVPSTGMLESLYANLAMPIKSMTDLWRSYGTARKGVVVAGPPWNTRFVTCFTVSTPRRPNGSQPAYRGVQYARLRWGRVQLDDILPDTQAVASYFAA